MANSGKLSVNLALHVMAAFKARNYSRSDYTYTHWLPDIFFLFLDILNLQTSLYTVSQ